MKKNEYKKNNLVLQDQFMAKLLKYLQKRIHHFLFRHHFMVLLRWQERVLISSYCEAYDFQSWIFRFVSILGQHYSHGHVYDFIKQLRENPNELKVLGDGSQRKSYLHVDDCIRAIDCGFKNSNEN